MSLHPSFLGAFIALLLLGIGGSPALADDSVERYRDGAAMDAAEAAEMERKSEKRPKDWKLHATLLGYWTRHGAANPAEAKPARALHLLWLIENRPEASVLLHPQASTVNLREHPLADAETFAKAKELWMKQLESAGSVDLLHAAAFLAPQDPQAAFELIGRLPEKDGQAQDLLGQVCASAYIGALGVDHTSEFSLWPDADLPQSPLAAQCKQLIEQTEDPDLLRSFVIKAARDGSEFFLDGKLDWDYSAFLQGPAKRALEANPENAQVRAIPGLELPKRDSEGARIVSMARDETHLRRVHSVAPVYPERERQSRVTGTATLLVMIAPDGNVARIDPVAGPLGLQEAAAAAVSQWRYAGLEFHGRRYYVLTPVQVNFALTPR